MEIRKPCARHDHFLSPSYEGLQYGVLHDHVNDDADDLSGSWLMQCLCRILHYGDAPGHKIRDAPHGPQQPRR